MKRIALVAVVAIGLCSLFSHAQEPKEKTGDDLLSDCQPLTRNPMRLSVEETRDAHNCMGYLAGMKDMLTIWHAQAKTDKQPDYAPMCVPYEATNEELVRVVLKALSDNPTWLHQPRAVVVYSAFVHAYPCKAGQ